MKIILVEMNKIKKPVLSMRREFDSESLQDLADSIKNNGLINPITLKKEGGNYEIVAGDRRFEACKLIGADKIAAIVYEKEGLDSERIKIDENFQREDVNVIDEGLYLVQIKEKYNCTQKEIAHMINRTESYVSDRIKATQWHPDLKVAVQKNLINFSIARELARLESEEQLYQCMNSVMEYGTTPAQARKWVNDYRAADKAQEEKPNIDGLTDENNELPSSRLLQSCQLCQAPQEPRDMIYLTICRSCSDTIKKAM